MKLAGTNILEPQTIPCHHLNFIQPIILTLMVGPSYLMCMMRPSLFFTTPLSLISHVLHRHGVSVRSASTLQAMKRYEDGTIVISPDKSAHSASVILCHGLGDTAEGWAEPAQVWLFCSVYFILCVQIRWWTVLTSLNITVFCQPITTCQIHSPYCSSSTCHIKHGNGNAFVVWYNWYDYTVLFLTTAISISIHHNNIKNLFWYPYFIS